MPENLFLTQILLRKMCYACFDMFFLLCAIFCYESKLLVLRKAYMFGLYKQKKSKKMGGLCHLRSTFQVVLQWHYQANGSHDRLVPLYKVSAYIRRNTVLNTTTKLPLQKDRLLTMRKKMN